MTDNAEVFAPSKLLVVIECLTICQFEQFRLIKYSGIIHLLLSPLYQIKVMFRCHRSTVLATDIEIFQFSMFLVDIILL